LKAQGLGDVPVERLLTALVLTPLAVIAVLWLPEAYFAAFAGLVVLVGASEWLRLSGVVDSKFAFLYLIVLAGGLLLCEVLVVESPARPWLTWAACLWWAGVTGWIWTRRRIEPDPFGKETKWGQLAIGLFVLTSMWLAIVALHGDGGDGPRTVLFLLVLVWVADSGAYLAGRRWGRRKLAPGLSPGKTWEGVLGGGLGAVVLGVGWSLVYRYPPGLALGFVVLCVSTAVVSVVGDLLESWMKRGRGVKDSGAIFPGHGGLLDRIDSLTAAAPWFVGGLGILNLNQ